MEYLALISLSLNGFFIYLILRKGELINRSFKNEVTIKIQEKLFEDFLNTYIAEHGIESYKRFKNILLTDTRRKLNGIEFKINNGKGK